MGIKEIALKLLAKEYPGMRKENQTFMVEFAEILIAELAKGNEPCAFLHEWIEYHPFGDTVAGEPFATITNDEKPFDSSDTVSPCFTFPPTVEQIANETAAAIAKFVAFQRNDIPATGIEFAEVIRSGAWKEFK